MFTVRDIAVKTGVSICGPVPLPTKKLVVHAGKALMAKEVQHGIIGK